MCKHGIGIVKIGFLCRAYEIAYHDKRANISLEQNPLNHLMARPKFHRCTGWSGLASGTNTCCVLEVSHDFARHLCQMCKSPLSHIELVYGAGAVFRIPRFRAESPNAQLGKWQKMLRSGIPWKPRGE